MLIDFRPVFNKEKTLGDLATQYSPASLLDALNDYVDFTIQLVNNISDQQVAYVPNDTEANDPYAATEAEQHIGWSIIHLVMHVTASAEEGAAFSSLLARGVAIGGRLRSERNWQEVTTCADTVARLEECRRMCRGYLMTWPDQPDLTTTRILSETATWTPPNAPASFLGGLMHWHRHIDQLQKVAEEARQAVGSPQ